MRRRDFIKAIAVSTSWPLAAHAQQSSLPVIGFLTGLGRNDRPSLREGFRRGLGDGGYVEGHNLAIEYRFAENQYDQSPTLAADLVGRRVAAIAATGSGSAILAAKASTADNSDRVHNRWRPGARGLCPQPQPAGWQYHRNCVVQRSASRQAARAAARTRSRRRSNRPVGKSKKWRICA